MWWLRFDGSLYFANVAYFEDAVLGTVANQPNCSAWFVLNGRSVTGLARPFILATYMLASLSTNSLNACAAGGSRLSARWTTYQWRMMGKSST